MKALVMGRSVTDGRATVEVGDQLEVVGFVHHGRVTWAVYRDDAGLLHEVPTWAIRMLPYVEQAEVNGITYRIKGELGTVPHG